MRNIAFSSGVDMAETVHARILRYLIEAHATEHHLEKVFQKYADSGTGSFNTVLNRLSQRAASHQVSLEAALSQRSTTVSNLRTGIAGTLALAPLNARMGDTITEKVSQQRIFAIAATAYQKAAYASLAAAASVVREDVPAQLARRLLAEEEIDLEALRETADTPMETSDEQPQKLVIAYLEDTIAAEHSFESQTKSFAKEAEQQPEAQSACTLFTQHAKVTREDFEQLTRRLQSLGGEPSVVKGFFAEVFNLAPKLAAKGHDANEHLTQDVIMLFAIANAQVAIFIELQRIADIAEDETTGALTRAIAQKKRSAVEQVWAEIEPSAQVSIGTMPYSTSS
jgi:ferritin-like metal-binding protein YciE